MRFYLLFAHLMSPLCSDSFIFYTDPRKIRYKMSLITCPLAPWGEDFLILAPPRDHAARCAQIVDFCYLMASGAPGRGFPHSGASSGSCGQMRSFACIFTGISIAGKYFACVFTWNSHCLEPFCMCFYRYAYSWEALCTYFYLVFLQLGSILHVFLHVSL